MKTTTTSVGFAAAAALIALTAAASGTASYAKGAKPVACYGINSCKGTSDCKSGNHDCKGMNDCKGQGFKELSKKSCVAMGGTLTAPAQ